MRKRIFLLLLAVILGGCAVEDGPTASAQLSYVVSIKGGQSVGLGAWERITESWVNESGEYVQPDEFGGCYFAEDNHLVIKVVDGAEEFIERAKSVVDDPSVLQFETTDISLNELYLLKEEIAELTEGIFASVGVSQKDSAVVVRVNKSRLDSKEDLYKLVRLTAYDHVEIELRESNMISW